MATYNYKAKKGPSEIIKGKVQAESQELAVQQVIGLGYTPIDISLAKQESGQKMKAGSPAQLFSRKKVKLTDLVIFTRQLSDLMDASVPLNRAIQITADQTENAYFKGIIESIHQTIKDGGSLSSALSKYPDIFSQLYINMVKAGEVGGQLNIILNRLADYLEKEEEIRGKIISSLAYPLLILVVGGITVFVLLAFIIPRLMVIFDDLDQEMPLITSIILNISAFFAQYWWLMIFIVVMGGMYFNRFIKTDKGRAWFDTLKLRLPLLGPYVKIVEISRFSRTLATLVECGVHITIALNSVWATVGNVVLQREIKDISTKVTSGTSIKNALADCTFFPSMAVNMISVGEETGHLERGLYKIANTYDRQSESIAKTMLSLLGPLVLVFIVMIVGVVVISILLPIFQMNTLIQ